MRRRRRSRRKSDKKEFRFFKEDAFKKEPARREIPLPIGFDETDADRLGRLGLLNHARAIGRSYRFMQTLLMFFLTLCVLILLIAVMGAHQPYDKLAPGATVEVER